VQAALRILHVVTDLKHRPESPGFNPKEGVGVRSDAAQSLGEVGAAGRGPKALRFSPFS